MQPSNHAQVGSGTSVGLTGSLPICGSHGLLSNSGAVLLPKVDEGLEEGASNSGNWKIAETIKKIFGLRRDIAGEGLSASNEEELSEIFRTGVH